MQCWGQKEKKTLIYLCLQVKDMDVQHRFIFAWISANRYRAFIRLFINNLVLYSGAWFWLPLRRRVHILRELSFKQFYRKNTLFGKSQISSEETLVYWILHHFSSVKTEQKCCTNIIFIVQLFLMSKRNSELIGHVIFTPSKLSKICPRSGIDKISSKYLEMCSN